MEKNRRLAEGILESIKMIKDTSVSNSKFKDEVDRILAECGILTKKTKDVEERFNALMRVLPWKKTVYVNETSEPIYVQPDTGSEVVTTVKENETLFVITPDGKSGFYKVITLNDITGGSREIRSGRSL